MHIVPMFNSNTGFKPMTTTFDAAKVTITRKRFSQTQGEVLVEYDGHRIEQYGDKYEIRNGEWVGYADEIWIEAAKREAIARGLATAPAPVFEAGKVYKTRSIVDADYWVTIEVVSRTAKTVKAKVSGKLKTLRVAIGYDGAETVKPWGSYSMCPVISAA